jgi:hydroxypyruvate reductase
MQHPLFGDCYVIAIGKAAASMAEGAAKRLGRHMRQALVITKEHQCGTDSPRTQCIESSHPIPDQRSLAAGSKLMRFIRDLPKDTPLLVLISGGASALVEVLADGVNLSMWREINEYLLSRDYDIGQINAVRKRLSKIKGGQLAQHVAGQRVVVLMLSDVPGDEPATIGSGLLAPEQVTDIAWFAELPAAYRKLLENVSLPNETDRCFDRVQLEIVGNLSQAKHAAADFARQLGYRADCATPFVDGDALRAGHRLAQQLLERPPGVYIWGGETTVTLPPKPGRGGRNQSLALAAAVALQGHDNVCFLSAGTDGTDGPGKDAGALVDGSTIARGIQSAIIKDPPEAYLANADAGTFLEASGDLLRTGPTGTNVMDLIIGLKW